MKRNSGNVLLIILVVVGMVTASIGGYFWWTSKVPVPDDPEYGLENVHKHKR